MKLLYVIHYPVYGGPHNQALRLNEALAARGWRTTVLLPDEPGNAADRLRSGGVEVVQTRLSRLRAAPDPRSHAALATGFVPEILRIRDLIRQRGIDLVVIGGLVNLHAAFAARMAGVPVVWQIVDSRTPGPVRRAMAPIAAALADALMFTGAALVRLHYGKRPPHAPWFAYYPPVDTARFVPSDERRRLVRRHLGVPDDAPVVGTVANLNPQKGLEHFVRAASVIGGERPDAWFVVVGAHHPRHRQYAARIAEEVRRSPVPDERFVFAGGRPDVEAWYPAMDAHLITSVPRSEGTATTAIEAMACGVPVVATDVGAVREVVEDGVTGAVVPPLDANAIGRAALRLLGNPDLRARMGDTGRRRAVERYSVEACADAHVRAFEAALSRKRSRRGSALPSGEAGGKG